MGFRAIRLEGQAVRCGGQDVCEPGAPLWLDMTPDPENLRFLGERFGFHPLALEDCAHEGQRTKFEDYGSSLFIVMHRLAPAADESALLAHELHCFLTADVVVTVHRAPIGEVDRVFDRCSADGGLLNRGPDFVLYLLFDALTDIHFAVAEALTDEIEELAGEVMERRDEEVLERILGARRSQTLLRRRLAPQREVFAALARPGEVRVRKRNAPYFRDVLDHLLRIHEDVDVGRELLSSTMEAHLSMANNQMTVVMTRLTLVATIFLPLNAVSGFFGMNLEILPPRVAIPLVIGIFASLPLALVWWFRRKRLL
jgi:magnesium transporter